MASQTHFASIADPPDTDCSETFVFPARFDDLQVKALPFTVRTQNVLANAGIKELHQLRVVTTSALLKRRNCGEKTIADIRATIAKLERGE
jgi:DNA-directed RNA polymerase alpha subunit